jgi:hypothetical protein
MLVLKKATDRAFGSYLAHAVNSSCETSLLRLTNQLGGISLCFSLLDKPLT